MGLIVVVSLGAYAEPTASFSISESDRKEDYADRTGFESIYCLPGSTAYEFKVAPESVYGIKTGDLNVVEGKICFLAIKDSRLITMVVQGEDSIDKFIDRIIKSDYVKGLSCGDEDKAQNSRFLFCIKNTDENMRRVSLVYDSDSGTAEFTIQILN